MFYRAKQKSSVSNFYAQVQIFKTSTVVDPIILNIKRRGLMPLIYFLRAFIRKNVDLRGRYSTSTVTWAESESESFSVLSNSLWPHQPHSPSNSPGQNTEVGTLSLLQGIFPTQGLNPGLPHCRQILYQLSHKGSPRIPEWVASPIFSRSSQPRNWTGVSCIARGFFTNWPIREALD